MDSRLSIPLLLGAIIISTVLSGTVLAEEAPKSDKAYTIPAELTPVSEWADGFTADEADKFRLAYNAGEIKVRLHISKYCKYD